MTSLRKVTVTLLPHSKHPPRIPDLYISLSSYLAGISQRYLRGISNLTKKTIANLHICFFPMAYFPQPSFSHHHSNSCSSPKPTSDALLLFSHLLPHLINSHASSVYPLSISTDTSTLVSFLLSCCNLLTGFSYWTLDCLHIC